MRLYTVLPFGFRLYRTVLFCSALSQFCSALSKETACFRQYKTEVIKRGYNMRGRKRRVLSIEKHLRANGEYVMLRLL